VNAPPTTTTSVSSGTVSSTTLSGNATVLAEWTKVAICEEGGWGNYGFPAYPDSLGINAANWFSNGGGSDLSPWAQIAVAQRLVGSNVPDQNGCASW
jgi:hypothetical protein